MDEKQEIVQKKAKRHAGAIISWVFVVLIIIIAGGLLYLHFSKPSAQDALNSAAKTNIHSIRSTIITKQNAKKKNSETLNYEVKGDTVHITNRFVPENKDQEQETWITGNKFYFLNNGQWNYMERNSLTNTFISTSMATYKKLFTGHDFSKLSKSAMNKFKVNLDGLDGYTLTYKGNDKEVIKGIQRVASGDNSSDASQIKNVDVTIKINRQKKLVDYTVFYTLAHTNGTTSIHLTDINQVNKLTLPSKVKKATKIVTPNLR